MEPYSYNWYNDGHWVGDGDSYTGGKLDGSISSSFRLRLDASDAEGAFNSHEITVYEDPDARICLI